MAFAIAGGLINWTVDKLSALIPPQIIVASAGESSDSGAEDLKRLERTMKRIQSILLDASPNQDILDHSEKLRLEELEEVAYDAEDLVEEYAYEVLHAKIQARSKMGEEVNTDLSSIAVSVPVPEEMALRAKVIRESFDEIVGEWEKLRWVESDGVRRQSVAIATRPPTSSLVDEPSILGRNQDKQNVIASLLNKDAYGHTKRTGPCVLPIVGMGGVGKTTLAQIVYNDPTVNSHFDLKGWVCVSKEFNVKALTQVIVTSLTKEPCEPMQLDVLQRTLEEKIKEKRFLLVLDDVWNEKPTLWHSLRIPFFCSRSSKILVTTTRSEKVAKIMQTIPFYPLRCLWQQDSWQLFKQVAFENQDPGEHTNMLEIGRRITTKCGGLPLALRAIGCALRFEPEEEFWRAILESDLWDLEVGLNEVLPALRLSYDCMPENMKECFKYLSLFPKDTAFVKENTVRFWSSLGFLKLESGRSAEDAGRQYLDDMQQRSLLQRIQYDKKTCVFLMHDLVQKLAEFVAGDSFRKLNTKTLNSSTNKSRYLSVVVNELPKSIDLGSIQQSSSLRALQFFNTVNMWLGKDISINLNEQFFQNLRSLRVLNFSHTGIRTLPHSIGNLKQLRFLGLARTKIETLPESIGYLYNLQTMDLLGGHLQELPKGIKNLVNLRHLYVEKLSNICMPCGISHLTNLEILPVFNIEIGSGRAKLSEIGKLSKLRGELRITGLDNVQHINDVMLVDLFNKQHIHVLMLDWSHCVSRTDNRASVLVSDVDHGLVLEALKPQLNLEVLEIYHYPGLSYPKWLGDSLYCRLGKLVLFGNSKISCKFLPSLGRLPSLRDLSIQCMLTIEYVGNEFPHHDGQNKAFPSLSTLEFKYMPRWVQWFGVRNGDFCSLRTLKIISCNALRFMPEYLSFSLDKLIVNHCKELAILPTNLTSLTSLILMGDINTSLFRNSTLPSLKSLQIGFSQNMKYVMLAWMPSVEVLVIKSCKNLKYLSGLTGLVFLRELELDECLSLDLEERVPPSLEILKVTNCPGLWLWEQNQRKVYRVKLGRRDTSIDNELEAYEASEALRNEYEETFSSNIRNNDELQPALPIVGDDYNTDWLLSVARISQYSKGDQIPIPSRKRLRNGSMKGSPHSSDKGKQICDDSSGSSIADSSCDSELGSFGETSEEDCS